MDLEITLKKWHDAKNKLDLLEEKIKNTRLLSIKKWIDKMLTSFLLKNLL